MKKKKEPKELKPNELAFVLAMQDISADGAVDNPVARKEEIVRYLEEFGLSWTDLYGEDELE